MDISNLTIAQVREIIAMFGDSKTTLTQLQAATPTIDHGLAIVALDRGFVYIGHVTTDANWCHIQNAQCIRRWGTERGLGQLANEGPQVNTKLDPAGTVKAPMRAVIHVIAVKADKWTQFSR